MRTIYALWLRNIRAFVREKARLVFSIAFPFFFIFVFGSIFKNEFIENPVNYMLAGMIIATVFDFSLRISSSTIDDIISGFMKEVLVSPIPRTSIAVGQFLSSATIATLQGLLILVVGFFIGFRVTSPFTFITILLAMIFVGIVFAGFGLYLAATTKNTQTFEIVSMAIVMPMTFISGAYIPFSLLPKALAYVGYFNPMTYAVALFRTIALEKTNAAQAELISEGLALQIGNFTVTPLIAFLFLACFGFLFLALSTITFINLDFSRMNRNKNDSIDW